jgi:hypothetical protein
VMSTFKGLVLPDLDNNYRLLSSTPALFLKSAAVVAEVMHKAGILHQQTDLKDLIRPEYLPKMET